MSALELYEELRRAVVLNVKPLDCEYDFEWHPVCNEL
jgi:hypothetical protein